MEKEKNNKGVIILLTVIIVILAVLCVLFATDTISFNSNTVNNNTQSNSNINEAKNTNENSSNSQNSENQTGSSWVNYLLSRHILDAKITRIRSKDLGDSEEINKTITLTMDDVKEILSKLDNNKLSKTWSEGRGGPERDHLIISYENNDKKYEFEIYYGDISVNKLDDEFKSILEVNKYEEKNTEYKNIQGAYYFYDIENYTETIFDKY